MNADGHSTSGEPVIVATFPDQYVICDACEQLIEPGTRVVLDHAFAWRHEIGCPPRWTPRLLDGGRSAR